MSELVLYTYFRSSCSYRVRIALALKGLACESHPVHLVREGGEQYRPDYRALNPQALVPTLVHKGQVIRQSLAIIEYLEEAFPEPALLPRQAPDRAYVRSLALIVACEIQPLNNLRVLNRLRDTLGAEDRHIDDWYRHWLMAGLESVEALLADSGFSGACCYGDSPGLADACLIPQIYNAQRYECPWETLPHVKRVHAHCTALPAFQAAAPEQQPDSAAHRL